MITQLILSQGNISKDHCFRLITMQNVNSIVKRKDDMMDTFDCNLMHS